MSKSGADFHDFGSSVRSFLEGFLNLGGREGTGAEAKIADFPGAGIDGFLSHFVFTYPDKQRSKLRSSVFLHLAGSHSDGREVKSIYLQGLRRQPPRGVPASYKQPTTTGCLRKRLPNKATRVFRGRQGNYISPDSKFGCLGRYPTRENEVHSRRDIPARIP